MPPSVLPTKPSAYGLYGAGVAAWRVRRVLGAGLLLATAAVAAAPLTLAEAQRRALCAEPGAVALSEQADAFDELAVAVGALPTPQIRFGAANLPLEGGGFRTEAMTQAQLGVRQAFPPATARAAATQRERMRADQRRAQAEERRRLVLLAVRNAWLDAFLASRSWQLVLDSRTLFADLVAITRSLYTVGDKNQQDLLRAELERSQLETRLVGIEQKNQEARAVLSRWIDDAAARPLAASLSEWPPPPSLDVSRDALAHHPALASAAALVAVGDAAVALARARYRPSWTLDAAYGYRDGALLGGSPRSDFFSITATLSAPMFTANREDRRLRAAQAQHRAAVATRDDTRRQLQAELLRQHGRWADLHRREALYRDAVLPQARANAEATLAAYRSEAGDFADVMRSHIGDLEVRLEHLALRVDQRRSHAELAYLGGFDPTGSVASQAGGCGAQAGTGIETP